MYDILCKELELTNEQTEKIQERRYVSFLFSYFIYFILFPIIIL